MVGLIAAPRIKWEANYLNDTHQVVSLKGLSEWMLH
jgi:hypothetical protein